MPPSGPRTPFAPPARAAARFPGQVLRTPEAAVEVGPKIQVPPPFLRPVATSAEKPGTLTSGSWGREDEGSTEHHNDDDDDRTQVFEEESQPDFGPLDRQKHTCVLASSKSTQTAVLGQRLSEIVLFEQTRPRHSRQFCGSYGNIDDLLSFPSGQGRSIDIEELLLLDMQCSQPCPRQQNHAGDSGDHGRAGFHEGHSFDMDQELSLEFVDDDEASSC